MRLTQSEPQGTRVISLCHGRESLDGEKRKAAFTSIIKDLNCQHHCYSYDDLTLDRQNYLDVVGIIQREIDSFKPQRVFSTSEYDLHRDHQIVAEASKVACRPLQSCSVRELYQFKIPGPVTGALTLRNSCRL